jgi:hypothetical protein
MATRRVYAFALSCVIPPRRVLVVYKLECAIKKTLLQKSSSEYVLHAVGESFNYEFPQQQDEHNRITNRSASSVTFRNCSYREVARPVCRRSSHVAALVLNSELSTFGKRIGRSMDVVEQHMMQTRTVPQFLTLSQIFNILEIVRSRVSSLSESSLRLLFSMSKLHYMFWLLRL